MRNPGYIKSFILLLVLTLITTGCGSASSNDPAEVLKRFTDALNQGKVKECITLFAVNSRIESKTSGLKITGIDEIETFLENYRTWNHKLVVTGPVTVKGSTAITTINEYDDQLAIMGLEKLRSHCECTVYGGQINQLILEIEPQDKDLYMKQQAGVIGIVPNETQGRCFVAQVKTGSPAEKAGLKAGDLITVVNGAAVNKMRPGEVGIRIRGPVGSPVTLSVLRSGWDQPQQFKITRADRNSLPK
ncbi:MAG: PDZ domain-containing protein [Candidatus Saccharibacteria bacterium]